MTQAPQKPQLDQEIKLSDLRQPDLVIPAKPSKTITQTPFTRFINWFYDAPIRKKQLLTLLTAQTLTVLALLGVGAILVRNIGRQQLVKQSESELEATKMNYSIKVNQMGFGFRGQSDNIAIIDASLNDLNGRELTPQQRETVKRILQNEIKARNIEYATLVGKDLKIIVNANSDRTGETFDPSGLVSEVINNPQQIKTSEITPWADISKEAPPILSTLPQGKDVLTRYTITPIFRPGTKQVIGALVSGDVVDGKYSIVEDTINEFKGGYSGIYKIKGNNEFDLASSLNEVDTNKGQVLENKSILEEALNNSEGIVADRSLVSNNQYTVTAQVINNFEGKPVAVLVRGTPETALNQIVRRSLAWQGLTALLALLFNWGLINLLGQVIADRLELLQKATKKFVQGNYRARAEIIGKDEIGQLADTFNQLAGNIQINEDVFIVDSEKARIFQEITGSTTLEEKDVDQVFNRTLPKAKKVMRVDRLVIYRFKPDWSGYISNEAGEKDLPSAINEEINDPCIPENLRQAYLNGRVVPTEDVYNAPEPFSPEHLDLMVRLQIKSNLVVPIVTQGQLFALLIAHHCREFHSWEEPEIQFMREIALRFGVILDRVNILRDQMVTARRAEQLKEITLAIASGLTKQKVLEIAVNQIRPALGADRTIVYEFDSDWKGTIIAESVVQGYPQAIGSTIADPCFADKYVTKYQQGRVQATADIYQAGLTDCHIKQLQPFQVRANLVAPILVNQKLIGLLICHQCSGVRNWEIGEIELFSQLATQVGLGLERVNLISAQKQSETEQREARELLQRRALELLMQVDPVSQGDLTIRATVTEDEIGTIADSYNATIESLRKIVSQVQSAAIEVAETTIINESDVQSLQTEIREQVENIAVALEKIEQMSRSSNMVAESAEQAEEALQRATESVDNGDLAMNRTVRSIMQIRATVQQASEQVKRLGETTQNISTVVSLIGRFAAQTHMLALKASIEAARAGEQGLGFAVIADEVRTLATQSASATADIEKLVNEILNETKSVVLAMEEGTEQVIEGSKLVEETRQSLNQITAATVQINELVEVIAAAAFEQSENSEEVSEKMSDVAKVTEKTTISVSKLSDSFRQLLEVARQLESNVSQFKVN